MLQDIENLQHFQNLLILDFMLLSAENTTSSKYIVQNSENVFRALSKIVGNLP